MPQFPYLSGGNSDGGRDTCRSRRMCSVNYSQARKCHSLSPSWLTGPLRVLQRKRAWRPVGLRERHTPGGRPRGGTRKVCIVFHVPRRCVLRASPGLSPPHLPLPPPPPPALQVKATMYLSYFQAVGVPLCVYALFLFLCQQVASFCHGYWLSLWADDPTVDGRQTQAALRGSIFGILGCLQGTPHPPSSQPPSECSGLPGLPVPGLPCPS